MKPLYQTIFQDLWEDISQKQYSEGDRLASENDLCSRYKTSRQTVRNAIDLLIVRGVVERQPGKGVFIKQKNGARNGTGVLNIVLLDSWYSPLEALSRSYRQFLRGISNALPPGTRVSVQLPPAVKDSGAFWEAVGRDVDVALVVSPKVEVLKHLTKSPIPLIVLGTLAPNWANLLPSFRINSFKMGFDTGRLLMQNGHKQFGYCCLELENEGVCRFVEGVQSALFDWGLTWDPSLRVAVQDDWGKCRKAVDLFLEHDVTCIIMCERDISSTHHYLVSKGKRIPRDISLLVLEMDQTSASRPPHYSGFVVNQYESGLKTGQLLQRLLAGGSPSMQNFREVIDLPFLAGKTLAPPGSCV